MEERRLIIVSNRLPFQLIKEGSRFRIRESDGGLVSALRSYFEKVSVERGELMQSIWVGSAEFNENAWAKVKQDHIENVGYEVLPIFVDKKTYNKFYNGFCNGTLWPLFHYFPSFVEFNNHAFTSYEAVNKIFAEKIIDIVRPGDIVWIHDYQLMLLPGLLREAIPDATIGFFLHIPFPSYEVFRLLHRPWKEKIVRGLLGSDLIGFHTHEYVQHFLKTVQMVSGYDHKFRSIFLTEREVKAEMFPLGIDFEKFHNAGDLPGVREQKETIRVNFPDKKIIFSVDRLDYTKGVTHRLTGFERFLSLHSEWREKVVFILIVVPSRQIISKYNERKKLIEEEIGRINGKYSNIGWQPIIYRYSNLDFQGLVSLYQASDIGLITPLRDGMNLVAKEFIASRRTGGVLILSELAGAANEFGEAILVNPTDADEMAKAIATALEISPQAQEQIIQLFQRRLINYSVSHWIKDFLKQLQEIKQIQHIRKTKHLSQGSCEQIISRYRSAGKRLLLLDYDGTLVPYSKDPSNSIPDDPLLELLTRLSSDPATNLTIISGRDGKFLDQWFGHLPVTLVCEHGAGIRIKNRGWHHDPNTDQSWKSYIRPVLQVFCERSPGSFIEDKPHTLVWHYRNVETDLGFMRSRELLDNLHHLTHNADLQIMEGNKIIEVRVSGNDKGIVARKLVDDNNYDFIMALGDDKTDEDMFVQLFGKAYTIKIGAGHSAAQFYLSDQNELLSLLQQLPFN
jgi:trehalose 6-phosphate synthase/phosphatase